MCACDKFSKKYLRVHIGSGDGGTPPVRLPMPLHALPVMYWLRVWRVLIVVW